ncbi:MAG: hypothetical protein HY438_02645 [DPANN group archaeon]|nr:hypothetical protein [DPANN group archaeon]
MASVDSEIATEITELKEIVAAHNEIIKAGQKIKNAATLFRRKPLDWANIRQILFGGSGAEADLMEAQWQLRLAVNEDQRFIRLANEFERFVIADGRSRLSRIENSWVNSARLAAAKLKAVAEYIGTTKTNLLHIDREISEFLRDYAALPHTFNATERLANKLIETTNVFPQTTDLLNKIITDIERMLKVQKQLR